MSTSGAIDELRHAKPAGTWAPLRVVLALAVLSVLLHTGLLASGGFTLFIDEAQYADWARAPAWGYFSKPPAVAFLIAASTAMFGDSEFGVRALAMLAWSACAWPLALLARRVAPADERAPVWVAALWLAGPLAFLQGLVATTDALLLLCWSVALAALWLGVERRSLAAWMVFVFAVAVGLLDKYTMAALLPGAAWWAWRRGQGLPAALALLASLALFSPHLAWNHDQGWPTLRHTAEITVMRESAIDWWGPLVQAAAQAVLVGPLLLGLLLWRLRRPPPGAVAPDSAVAASGFLGFLLAVHLPLALAGLAQSFRGHLEINWVAPLHLAVVLAIGLHHRRWLRPTPLVAGLLGLQTLLLSAWLMAPGVIAQTWPGSAWADRIDLMGRTRGWAEALAELRTALPADRATVIVGTSRAVLAHAGWHWRDAGLARAAWRPASQPGHHYELSCPWKGTPPGVTQVLVLSEGAPVADLQAHFGGLDTLHSAPLKRWVALRGELVLSRARQLPPAQQGGALCR
jgi:4-amino-4-deoxy-L-arabinose transferase-like glycosyltransferase